MKEARQERQRTPFGQRMLDARKALGLTQEQVTAELGLAQSTLSELETTATGSSRTVDFARLYRRDAAWLATGEGADDTEASALADLRDIKRINPETYGKLVRELAAIADGLRATHKLLRQRHGVKGYVSPERAASALPKVIGEQVPAHARRRNKSSSFGVLDEAPDQEATKRRGK